MKKKLFYLLWLAIPLVSCEKGGGIPDTPINPPIHPKTNNDTLAWNNLQSSTWDRDTDFFIGTKYANVRNRGMDNDPGKNGVDCYSKNGHAVTVLTRQS
ncbi:hypothetical protein ABLT32_04305 [Bacteroides pyogenes]|uniref:hypothetical protein n=1 Tax=Bacteroides pyogenes TaxID=310300 RepID=UPI0040638225